MLNPCCMPIVGNTIPGKIIDHVPIVHNVCELLDNGSRKKRSLKTQNINSKPNLKQCKRKSIYLSIGVICKMINKFLVEKKMSKERLVEALEIRAIDLESLLLQTKIPPTLIPRVNLPLIKLYCETKFEDT